MFGHHGLDLVPLLNLELIRRVDRDLELCYGTPRAAESMCG